MVDPRALSKAGRNRRKPCSGKRGRNTASIFRIAPAEDLSDPPGRRGVIMDYWIVLADIPITDVVCQPEEVESAVYVTPEKLCNIYSDEFRWVGDDALYRDDVLELIARLPRLFAEFSEESHRYT